MIKTAQLRVYEPVVDTEVSLEPAVTVKIPPRRDRFGIVGESMVEDALIAEWRGVRYICPRTPALRALEGVLAIRRAYGQLGGGAVVGDELARAARTELETRQAEHPQERSQILTSAWHVPMRWFVPFHPSGKEIVTGEFTTVRYRTALAAGMERLDRAVEILSRAEIPDSTTMEVEELRTWLEPFSTKAMVELDYGDVARMFQVPELAIDDSVADVWAALDALAAGEWEKAGEHYGALVYRWTGAMSISYSS
ncbi:MAG: hypothetical protein OEX04_20715 [Acidimicrobiia bacterium]|nr:hypothetical protein [Acidimicrobiia bacterium]MDH4309903.1 hypothetical protein [Acidimicrobiia bacterium]